MRNKIHKITVINFKALNKNIVLLCFVPITTGGVRKLPKLQINKYKIRKAWLAVKVI